MAMAVGPAGRPFGARRQGELPEHRPAGGRGGAAAGLSAVMFEGAFRRRLRFASPKSRMNPIPDRICTQPSRVCLWDILGKAVNRPIYKILGGTKDRNAGLRQFPAWPTVEEFLPMPSKPRRQGLKGYKIHPARAAPRGRGDSQYWDMEEIREVRKASAGTSLCCSTRAAL